MCVCVCVKCVTIDNVESCVNDLLKMHSYTIDIYIITTGWMLYYYIKCIHQYVPEFLDLSSVLIKCFYAEFIGSSVKLFILC